jgi:hypothetical protein
MGFPVDMGRYLRGFFVEKSMERFGGNCCVYLQYRPNLCPEIKYEMTYILRKTQLSYILLVLATSFGLGRPSSGQNIYKNFIASAYNVLSVNVMGSHLQMYSSLYLMPAVVVLSVVSVTDIVHIYCYNIKVDGTNCKINYVLTYLGPGVA